MKPLLLIVLLVGAMMLAMWIVAPVITEAEIPQAILDGEPPAKPEEPKP